MNSPSSTLSSPELSAWLGRLERRHPTEIDLGLERCGEVYQRLGAPQPARRVITVAGTNGKGSTVAWSNACLMALGYRTGVYTSPHLVHFNERLQVLGDTVTAAELVTAFEQLEAVRDDVSLTYFEFTTLACLWLMARADLDVAILEVGMGGRLDTVNLIDADVAVITPVGLDHQAFLGNDREAIGREKAGILRAGQTFISTDRDPPESVLTRAETLGCVTRRLGQDFDLGPGPSGALEFRLGDWQMELPDLPLAGPHQHDNLAGALAAVLALHGDREQAGACLPGALREVPLRGRLQLIDTPPGYLLDVGHNPMAAAAIAAALRDRTPLITVLAMLNDKDAEGVARALAPGVQTFICAGLVQGQRSQDGPALAARVSAVSSPAKVIEAETVSQALAQATALAGHHGPILVFGSFHTVAEALQWLKDTGRLNEQ